MKKSLFSLWKIIRYLKDKDVDFGKKILFFVPIIYLVLPFDLIGDFFPLAGQLDDVAVFILMWPVLKKLLTNYYGQDYFNSRKEKKNKGDSIDVDKDDYEVE